MVHYLRSLCPVVEPQVGYEGVERVLDDETLEDMAHHVLRDDQSIHGEWALVHFVKGVVEAREPHESPRVDELRKKVLAEYAGRVFTDKPTPGDPPIRGPFGLAEIHLKPGATPTKHKMFHITGKRRAAWVKLMDDVIVSGKVEPGQGPWSSPSFPVPKKKPG